jgi:hypothetical protein
MQHALAKQKYGNTKELWCRTLQLFTCTKILWEAAMTRLRDEIVTARCSLTQRHSVIRIPELNPPLESPSSTQRANGKTPIGQFDVSNKNNA